MTILLVSPIPSFIYDQAGQVIAEIDAATGETLREYIYVNGQQLAIVDDTGTAQEQTYFVHNDHLGTPQKITDGSQAIVWNATYQPFGEVEVTTVDIENNIRFPGQYADEETGLHYNYFRDYDPSLGRYVESDPIGLDGGANTFSYVDQNPAAHIDPRGNVKWNGAVFTGGGGRLFGGAAFYMKFVSECVNEKYVVADVIAIGFGFAVGGKGAAVAVTTDFEDFTTTPNSSNLSGVFRMMAAGVTVSPVPPLMFGGPGIGGSAGWMQVGRAFATPSVTVTLGFDLSVMVLRGHSWVTNSETLCCRN